jgi:hypothetical protein
VALWSSRHVIRKYASESHWHYTLKGNCKYKRQDFIPQYLLRLKLREFSLLRCNTKYFLQIQPKCRSKKVDPSSGSKNKLRMKQAWSLTLPATCFTLDLAWLILRPWRSRNIFSRNDNWISKDYMALHHNYCCDNLKSCLDWRCLETKFWR